MASDYRLIIKDFSELTAELLYEILRLRTEVFVVEQNCVYQDMDGLDAVSKHFALLDGEGGLVSYARLILPHEGQDYVKFGRFITDRKRRECGAGTRVLKAAVSYARSHYPEYPLKVSGQLYLENYYKKQGFCPVSDVYLEDGIPHKLFLYEKKES